MKRHVLAAAGFALASLSLVGLSACEQGKPRHPPPDPMAVAPPADAAGGPAPAGVLSAGLPKRPEAAGFFLDRVGAAIDPRSRQPAVTPAGQATVFDGFGFDAPAKAPGKGVDLVVDGAAYGTVYGAARPDVASFFKAPALVNVGFKAVLPAGALAPGAHTVVVRVVAADGKGYFDSPTVAFTVN
ncbi:hypothetical protein [Phenylobacterium sp.]|uniref:hypothetical protein n=1 Tax=Phenylobacterium sp. TaxID=1871053 RepID=UPI002D1DF7AA|nr:hypothetical protein [Phenylobacterium sp.]HLZ76667.1 hypothetical protein [Phenylobacterium sp.]